METRFRANSFASSSISSGSRPSTPNNSILYDLLTQKESNETVHRIRMATLTNEHGYSLCLRTLQRSINFILEHPVIDSLDMQTKLAVIERNWLWVLLIDLAVSNVELNFGEITMTVTEQELGPSRPTKETAILLAHCLNCIRNQRQNGFSRSDIDLLKELCLLQHLELPKRLLDQMNRSPAQIGFGHILVSISKLQKVDHNQLVTLLFGSVSRPMTMLLSALRR